MPLPFPPPALTAPPSAPAWDPVRVDAMAARMPALLARHRVPGAAVALVAGGRVAWVRGFGTAGPGAPMAGDTVLQGASLTKPLTAWLAASLSAREGWSLDAPLGELAPELHLPAELAALTPARLLSHRAGVVWDEAAGRMAVKDPGPWRYSGAGYALLQRVVEARTHRDLQALASAELFGPAGMAHSSLVSGADPTPGHDRKGRPFPAQTWARPHGASSLQTTARDYGTFLVRVLDPASAELRARLLAPRAEVDRRLGLSWGLGWALERRVGGTAAFHWGSNPGFKSFAMVDPDRGLGLVILTNGDAGLELAEAAVDLLDPVRHPLFRFPMMHPDD